MKKILIVTAATLAIALILIFVRQSPVGKTAPKTKVSLIEAKTTGYNSLDELKKLPIILKGVKTKEDSTELQYSKLDNSLIGGHTVSSFKIKEVIQNQDLNSNIKVDNSISVMEYSFYNKEDDTIYSYNGYTNMKEDQEYILFLLPEEDNVFPIGSVTLGKIPVETNEIEIFQEELEANPETFGTTDKDIELLEKVSTEVRNEYQNN